MMESLLSGVPASQLFRALQKEDASIDARELGGILMEEFPGISPAASMSIRKWLSAGKGGDFPDEQIDGLISFYLKAAGYIA
jgi:predicted DNA-binding protein (MmcQ/YjbR family)